MRGKYKDMLEDNFIPHTNDITQMRLLCTEYFSRDLYIKAQLYIMSESYVKDSAAS